MVGMRKIGITGVLVTLAMLLGACTGGPTSQARELTHGEERDISRYTRVMIDPVTVTFAKNWYHVQTGTHFSMSRQQREDLEQMVESTFNRHFAEELASGRLELVDSTGPGVVRISPALSDVYLSAPLPYQQPGTTYVRSVGHMALTLQFRDGASGEQLFELHSRVRGREIGLLRPASPAHNQAELTDFFKDWAKVVRQELFHVR